MKLDPIVEDASLADVYNIDELCKITEPDFLCEHRGHLVAGRDYLKCERCGGSWSTEMKQVVGASNSFVARPAGLED